MDAFSALFGSDRSEIAPTCVLLPYARKNVLGWLGVSSLSRGRLYQTGRGDGFSAVQTGMGAVYLGDAVLYLAEAGAKNFVLFSACGLLSPRPDDEIGSLLVPRVCSDLGRRQDVGGAARYAAASPDPGLLRLLLSCPGAREVAAASVGSLKDVEENPERLRRSGIEAVDLECAALFSAARETRSRAGALLYVTDIPGVLPHYRAVSPAERGALFLKVRRAAEWLRTSIGAKLSA
jgi:purine-nucleoside phosphorylase